MKLAGRSEPISLLLLLNYSDSMMLGKTLQPLWPLFFMKTLTLALRMIKDSSRYENLKFF